MMYGEITTLKDNVVSVNKQRVNYELPNSWYWIWVPAIATFEPDELKVYGVPMEGYVDELEPANLNRMVLVQWNISMMVDGFMNGYRITFDKESDVLKLHTEIEDYFTTINKIIKSNNGGRYIFDSRLEWLDKFNNSIYSINRGQINRERQELINKLSLANFMPEYILQDVVSIKDPASSMVAGNGYTVPDIPEGMDPTMYFSRYGPDAVGTVQTGVNKDNPLAPIYSQTPTIDMSNLQYESKYIDPMERRLKDQYDRLKAGVERKKITEE